MSQAPISDITSPQLTAGTGRAGERRLVSFELEGHETGKFQEEAAP